MSVESELWWVSVGREACEPARVLIEGADHKVFTIGCPDGTWIKEGCGIDLVKKIETYQVPQTPAEAERRRTEWEAGREADRKKGIYHSYRRFT